MAPRVVYDLDDAVEFVADRVPAETAARISHDEVRELLRAHMRRLHAKGLHPAIAEDQRQDLDELIVMDELDEVAYVIGAAERAGLDMDDGDVAAVIDGHLEYLAAIGAVGPRADQP